jgi:HAD superfamily hydrolase (TIGR01509 family)
LELVIFDCDGVLVDSEIISFRVEAAALSGAGIPVTTEALMKRFVGTSSASMYAVLAREHALTLPADFEARTTERALACFDAELQPIKGIAELLAGLQAARCVASSSAPDRIRHSLRLAGILPYFEPHIFSAKQVARGKPAPDLFLFAAERMGVAPKHCLVIEDSVAGVTAARTAGMAVLGFTGGSHCLPGHGEKLAAAGAQAVFDSMAEIASRLREMAEEPSLLP